MTQDFQKDAVIFRFFRQSSHYAIGTIVLMLSGFFSMPILTRVFSKTEYGYLNLISITLFIAFAFSKAGTTEAGVRFYSEFTKRERKDELPVFYTTLLGGSLLFVLIISAVFWLGVHFFFKDLLEPEMRNLLWVVTLLFISTSLFARFTNFLRAEQRTKLLNFVLVVRRYFGLALGIALVFWYSRSLHSFFFGQVLCEVLFICIFTFVLFKQQRIKLTSFSPSFLKECLIFGFPLIGFELAGFLIKSLDRYLIQIFLGIEAVGVYSVGSGLCHLIRDAMIMPLSYTITPIYLELWSKKGEEETKIFISKVLYFYLLIVIPLVFGFIALDKQVILIVASSKYESAVQVIPYIISGAMFWSFYPLYAAGLYIHKKTKKLSSVIFVGLGINTVLNIILIPKMNLAGAALATFITYIVLTILLMKVSFRYLKIKVSLYEFAKVTLSSVVMFLAIQHIDIGTGSTSLIIKIILGIIIYSCIIFLVEKRVRTFAYETLSQRVFHFKKTLLGKDSFSNL